MVSRQFSLVGSEPAVALHRPGTAARLASEEVTADSLSAGGSGWSIVLAWHKTLPCKSLVERAPNQSANLRMASRSICPKSSLRLTPNTWVLRGVFLGGTLQMPEIGR